MQSVYDIAREILAREGGFVDDPDDPGGATNFGITIHTMRRLGVDLDGDGQVTRRDVKRLSRTQAADSGRPLKARGGSLIATTPCSHLGSEEG